MTRVREQNVVRLDPPAWNRCGRPKNGFATLQDGSSMCARYRDPHNKMVLGKSLCFILQIRNVYKISLFTKDYMYFYCALQLIHFVLMCITSINFSWNKVKGHIMIDQDFANKDILFSHVIM